MDYFSIYLNPLGACLGAPLQGESRKPLTQGEILEKTLPPRAFLCDSRNPSYGCVGEGFGWAKSGVIGARQKPLRSTLGGFRTHRGHGFSNQIYVGTLPQLGTYYLSNILYVYVPRRKGFPSGLPLWRTCLTELSCAWV